MRKVVLSVFLFTVVITFSPFDDTVASQRVVLGEYFMNTG